MALTRRGFIKEGCTLPHPKPVSALVRGVFTARHFILHSTYLSRIYLGPNVIDIIDIYAYGNCLGS